MSPAQMFHLPSALKRTRSAAVGNQRRQTDWRETKLHDVLGVTEADINTARNQRVSSAATTRLQDKSLSDATTEAGYSPPQNDRTPRILVLHSKASSVLLHDEYQQAPGLPSSTQSVRLKNYDSSSTLHSHYEAQKASLAVSQQTSDSSRRDFALRKGKPVVVKSTTVEQDSLRQFKFFKSSNCRLPLDGNKHSKTRPQTGHTLPPQPVTPTDRRSLRDHPNTPKSTKSMVNTSKMYKGVRFLPPPAPASDTGSLTVDIKTKNSLLEPMDPACVKVNIRRPKVGVKHWFDGLEGDSSEEDSIDEPELEQNFVRGIESAFQNDWIKANSSDASTITTKQLGSTISDSTSTPNSNVFPPIRPRQVFGPMIAVLSAKASKSNLSSTSQSHSDKVKLDPLSVKDLNQSSVLNLSSSDDEDEDDTTPPPRAESSIWAFTGPALRDSVANAFSRDSQVEFGVAKAVNPRHTIKVADPPSVKKPSLANQLSSRDHLKMPIPKRGSSLMLSYLNDQCEAKERPNDLLASFPPTPIESVVSHRTSILSSTALSDAGSMESRRLMSVTKQEESLLAAMRLKKATMRYHIMQDKRTEALWNLEGGHSMLSNRTPVDQRAFGSVSELGVGTSQPVESSRTPGHIWSSSREGRLYSRASGTTFQTTTSRHPSRMSRLTSQTDLSTDPETRLSLSSSTDSQGQSATPSLLSLSTADRRQSRDTYFSASSAGHTSGHARTLTINSNVVALDDLDNAPPRRDDIPSQEFIDWPYKGWEARAELGLAR